MPRLSMPGPGPSSAMKENKPAWCSPGRPHSTQLRTGRGKPLGELRPGNDRGHSLDGPGRPVTPTVKKAPLPRRDSPSATLKNSATKVVRAPPPPPSQAPTIRLQSPTTASRAKAATKAPVTEQTPPRSRPIRKPISALVTPTNKCRKPLTAVTTPTSQFRKPVAATITPTSKFRKPLAATTGTPRSITTKAKVSTPKNATSVKASTPGSGRAKEKSQGTEETPVRRAARERPRAGPSFGMQGVPSSGSRENRRLSGWAGSRDNRRLSGWAGSAIATATGQRGRKASPTHCRPPVKHLFLSPQSSKKPLSKKDLRKSVETHGIWVGSTPSQRKVRAPTAEKKLPSAVGDCEPTLPPTETTQSPEIPKRGSREASGEGIKGCFGAGPMVAANGGGFVRDRRKCKPRGTLMVGQEGLSLDSLDSGGALELSVQMAPPSVASVEWMMNNEVKMSLNLNDFSSGSFHEPSVSMSISDFPIRENNQANEFFAKEEKPSQEACSYDGAPEQLSLSSPNEDYFSQFSRQSQARGSFGEQHRTSLEEDLSSEGALAQLRLSNPNEDDDDEDRYIKFTKRSQAFLQHLALRQSQLTREVSFPYVRQSRQGGDNSFRPAEQQKEHPGEVVVDSDLENDDEDITIDWRQGLPWESMDVSTEGFSAEGLSAEGLSAEGFSGEGLSAEGLSAEGLSAGKSERVLRSSLSFTSSWVVPYSEGNSNSNSTNSNRTNSNSTRRLSGAGNAKAWCVSDSPWYGFSPVTPEFHRNSQLPEGGSDAIDALLAGSVRRRIVTDKSSSSSEGRLHTSCASLAESMREVNPADSASGLSAANSSQETTASFQFARASFASAASGEDMDPWPQDDSVYQTSSPLDRSPSPFSEDLLCQTASPIDEVCSVGGSIEYSGTYSIDCSLDLLDCKLDGSENASDDDEVEYASPIMSDYLCPVKRSVPSSEGSEQGPSGLSSQCDDGIEMGAKAMRQSSLSRTLEELMRHNFTL